MRIEYFVHIAYLSMNKTRNKNKYIIWQQALL